MSLRKKIGTIKVIDPRKIWPHEAYDFTKWLAKEENLSLLSEAIGVDIQTVDTEAKTGVYSTDILAEEEGGGRKVVIENQLQTTNHDHLGKIITYAAGHDASIVIWIFTDIKEEHRQAIDWLNENSSQNVSFFGINLRLIQIGDSKPAPEFQIVSKPNEWAKILKQGKSKEYTETALKQLEFWTKFKTYSIENGSKSITRTPRAQHWFDVSIGNAEAHIGLTVNTRDSQMGCELYIARNKSLYRYLESKTKEIEKTLGVKLEWRDLEKASRIVLRYKNFDIEDESRYEEYFKWLLDNTEKFKKVFKRYIGELKKR